uniref:hAT-like transposase RNase-H fold domain-containing protein n=1 Tax=Arundo donax TaxID=35708 RepID=A0A0A9HBG7_ARUDO
MYCHHVIAADTTTNGTSSMHRHFNSCKCNPHKFNMDLKQGTLQTTPGQGISTWRYDPEALREAFAEMIIEDELPFVFGEKAGFKKFMSVACPRFELPSRRTCMRDICSLLFSRKGKAKAFYFIKDNCERVCLTTYCWTSQQQDGYITVTAHFIDNGWKLHKKVISSFQVKGHKRDDIGKNLHRCLVEWGLAKVMTITVDNASSNDNGISYLNKQLNNANSIISRGKYLHMRCAAHIINLIVQDGLKEVDTSVKCVRGAVRYIKNGSSRLVKFKEFAEEEKVESKAFFNVDICTSWKSTYLMLQAVIAYEKVFTRYLEEDPYYAIDLDEENKGFGHPDESDWENAKKIADFLGHFHELTLCVSGSYMLPLMQQHNSVTLKNKKEPKEI